jgi:hypothetical protein
MHAGSAWTAVKTSSTMSGFVAGNGGTVQDRDGDEDRETDGSGWDGRLVVRTGVCVRGEFCWMLGLFLSRTTWDG